MVIYGKNLLQHVPEGTTDLLIDLCSGTLGKTPVRSSDVDHAKANGSGGQAVLSYLGYNRVAGMFAGDAPSGSSSSALSAGAESKAQPNGQASQTRGQEASEADGAGEALVDKGPGYEPPSPKQFFAHFVNHRAQFVRFLESVASTLWNQVVSSSMKGGSEPLPLREVAEVSELNTTISDQRAVWNTLLELYLANISSSDSASAKASKNMALGLLQSQLPYDSMHALILCSSAGFTEGMVGLWESMGMYEDVLRWYMSQPIAPSTITNSDDEPEIISASQSSSAQVLRYLGLYGPRNHHLYPLVLRYLTSSPHIMSAHAAELPGLLQTIDEQRIMPPLVVVQLLSRNGVASVGSVKEWLRAKVGETRQDVESVCRCPLSPGLVFRMVY
jgi:hypothetical protein